MNISRIKKSLLSILLLCIATIATAQTVENLCIKHIEHLGGAKAASKISSLKIKQIATSNKMEMPITTILVPGKVYYQTIKSIYGTSTTSVTQEKGWINNPFATPNYKELSPNTIKTYIINSKYLGPLYDYTVNGKNSDVLSISIEDTTNINRDICYKLQVTYKSGYTIHVYLSQNNYMIKKVDTPFGITQYDNYRKVKGVMMPYYIEISNQQGVMTSIVTTIQTNVNVDYAKIAHP